MRPKIDRRRLFSTVGTVALTDRSTINAYKAALLPARPFARPLDANYTQAESVPNFYQVQTFRRRNETRAISTSCLQPRDDFVDVHFVERDLCHRPNHEPDHFVKKTVPCNFDCDPRPASPNLSGPIVRIVSCSFLPRLAANAAKSCVPTNFFPAVFRRSTSNGDEMCHARPNSRGGRIGAAQIR